MSNSKLNAIVISLVIHLSIAYIFFFGLSLLKKLPEQENIIAIEITNIQEISNVKNQQKQLENKRNTTAAKQVKKSATNANSKEYAQKPTTPAPKNLPPKKTVTPPKKEAPKATPTQKQITPQKQAPAAQPAPKEKTQNKQNTPQKSNQLKSKANNNDSSMDSLLKNLEESSDKQGKKFSIDHSRKAKNPAESESKGEFKEELPLSVTEYNAIKSQLEQNWNIPIGINNAEKVLVTLYISLKIDGSVDKIHLINKHCPGNSPMTCQALVDSAIRAVKKSSPIQNLPSARYNVWKEFNFEFDPNNLLQ